MPKSKPLVPEPSPRRSYRGASGEARQAERRERLLEAGLEVIGTQGYRAATVRAICAEAGLTERYFYESFVSTESLLAAVYQLATTQLTQEILAKVSGAPKSPEGLARAGLRAYFAAIQKDPRAARVLYFEILGVSPAVDRVYQQNTRHYAKLLIQLSQPVLGGATLGREPDLLATGLVGAVMNISMHWLLSGYTKPLDAVVETCMELFIAVLRQRQTQS